MNIITIRYPSNHLDLNNFSNTHKYNREKKRKNRIEEKAPNKLIIVVSGW